MTEVMSEGIKLRSGKVINNDININITNTTYFPSYLSYFDNNWASKIHDEIFDKKDWETADVDNFVQYLHDTKEDWIDRSWNSEECYWFGAFLIGQCDNFTNSSIKCLNYPNTRNGGVLLSNHNKNFKNILNNVTYIKDYWNKKRLFILHTKKELWQEEVDPDSKNKYWWHTLTKESTWEDPNLLKD